MATAEEYLYHPKTVEDLTKALKDDLKIRVSGIDIDGVMRGKIMSKSKFLSICNSSSAAFGFCSVIFGWDIHDTPYPQELAISNKANGYGDILARIDYSTFRRLPFEDNIPLFLVTFLQPESEEFLYACPRAMLQKVLLQLKDQYQLSAYAGSELEYFNFKETPHTLDDKNHTSLSALTPGMHGYSMIRTNLNKDYFHGLFDASTKMGIEIEGHHTETGPGVYETALGYCEASKMADNTTLFKLTAKSVGMQYGIIPTFMAKPHNNLPGCSGHVHLSLRDASGKNIFAAESPCTDAKYPDLKHVSKELEHFLAGILLGLPDVMPCLVPTINGYKRLVENFWAPVTVSYGYETRLASVRIISPPLASPSATRIEVRVPGADMNAHFTIAALIGLGMHGMKNKLELDMPPINASVEGGQKTKRLPKTLLEATERMMRPESLARVVMGDEFVDHFGATRMHEWETFTSTVTSWEMERYMELV